MPLSKQDTLPVAIVGGAVDAAGNAVDPDSYAQVLTNTATGKVATIAFTNGTNTWTRTFTYDGSDCLTNISQWVRS